MFSCFDVNPRNIANVRLQKLQRRGFGGNFQILERSFFAVMSLARKMTLTVNFLARLITAKKTENKDIKQSAILSRDFSM